MLVMTSILYEYPNPQLHSLGQEKEKLPIILALKVTLSLTFLQPCSSQRYPMKRCLGLKISQCIPRLLLQRNHAKRYVKESMNPRHDLLLQRNHAKRYGKERMNPYVSNKYTGHCEVWEFYQYNVDIGDFTFRGAFSSDNFLQVSYYTYNPLDT
jgi:hypothetical protein